MSRDYYQVVNPKGEVVEKVQDLLIARDKAQSRADLYRKTYQVVVDGPFGPHVLATCKPQTRELQRLDDRRRWL